MVKKRFGYFVKFILLHVITYVLVGAIFYTLQDYEGAIATQEYFQLWRSLDHPLIASAIIPIQIIRGGMLGLFLYPFYNTYIKKKHGWFLLFGLIYGFTALSAMLPQFINTLVTGGSLAELVTGPAEISVQMLLFSLLLFTWERKKESSK